MALISAEELAGLEASLQLLRSTKNAERLLAALTRALGGTVEPSSVEELQRELGESSIATEGRMR